MSEKQMVSRNLQALRDVAAGLAADVQDQRVLRDRTTPRRPAPVATHCLKGKYGHRPRPADLDSYQNHSVAAQGWRRTHAVGTVRHRTGRSASE